MRSRYSSLGTLNIPVWKICLHNWISSCQIMFWNLLHSRVNIYPAVFPLCKPQAQSIIKVNAINRYNTFNWQTELIIPSNCVLSLKSRTNQILMNARSGIGKVSPGKRNRYQIPFPRIVINYAAYWNRLRRFKTSRAQESPQANYITFPEHGTSTSVVFQIAHEIQSLASTENQSPTEH